jgi:hypothetical protein
MNFQFMNNANNYGLINLAKRTMGVIATSLGLLSAHESKCSPQIPEGQEDDENSKVEKLNKRNLKPKLILKLKSGNSEDYILAQHRSHSSHSSHRSHYSSSSGSKGSGGGAGLGTLIVGGLIALGAYGLGKSNREDKK